MAISEMWQWLSEAGNITLTLVVATVAVVVYYTFTRLRSRNSWEKYGVKQAVLGNEVFSDFREGIHKLIREHGDTVGTGYGSMSMLLTTNLNLLRMILVKDFNNFADRDETFCTNSKMKKGVFFLDGSDWKRVRHVISPSFSSGKIKGFVRKIHESATNLTKVIEDHAIEKKPVAIKDLAGQYTVELTAKLAFGLDADCIGKENDEFTYFAKRLLKIHSSFKRTIMGLLYMFPKVLGFVVNTLRIGYFDEVCQESDAYLNSVLQKTVAERQRLVRNGEKLRNDFLQNLVVAKEEGDKAVAVAAATGTVDTTEENAPKTLTEDELYGQALLIILAGFETTSTTLQFCLYLLAKHPDVQEKLFQEITCIVKSDVPTYEELCELKYTDQVISETLRLYPPAPIAGRKAKETKTYGDITIPKGTFIILPYDLIMMDPKHYEDPEKFDPDRFTDENKAKRDPMAFVPFGSGPRICIGRRMALLELKIGLVNLIRKLRFELDEKMKEEKLKIVFQSFLVVENPIKLTARLRE